LNRLLAGIAAVLLFHSLAVAAPHFFKTKPEPVEKPGALLRERMARKFGAVMRAPGSYPASANILFLRVEFQTDPDPSNSLTTGSGLWGDPLYAHTGDPDYWINKAATNFINYWKEVSYDNLIVSAVTSTAIYKLPYTMTHYGNESSTALENLIFDSVTAAKADIDFTLYDSILIVHAGCGEESDILNDSSNDIWSLFYSDNSIAPNANPDTDCSNCLEVTGVNGTKRITEAIIMPQSDSQDNYTIDPLGVYVHEFGHWLGLPDLYCTELFCPTDGVGKWSLMGDGIYNADPADCPVSGPQCQYGGSPAHLDAWSKVYLGWVVPATADPPADFGNKVFNPVEIFPDIVKVQASTSTSSQYFLVENRQQTGFDKGLPGHGLLIWLIDDATIFSNLASNSINSNRDRPGVKVIEADNDWNLLIYGCDTQNDCGSPGDPFPGSTNNMTLTPHSTPGSLPYTASAWVNIRNITESGITPAATTITSDIGFSPVAPKTPVMNSNVVSWSANAEPDIATYHVYKNGTRFGSTTTTSLADTAAGFGDRYQVTAVDAIGDESDFSGQVTANMQRNSNGGNGNPQCFIATAAYGSPLEPHVMALRAFRDNVLLKNAAGRAFVSFYYRFSPPVAGFIGRHETVRTMARWGLTPIVYGVRYPLVFTLLSCWVMLIAFAGYRHIKRISF
jgi:M6 family metalloprotease-like protein